MVKSIKIGQKIAKNHIKELQISLEKRAKEIESFDAE